jgi:hypothetical protein
MKKKRLKHVIRVDHRRDAKKCIGNEPEGRINLGRTKLKWLENTENDLGELGREETEEKGK